MTQLKTPFTADGILALLRSQGMRVTRSRRGIMQALFKASRPLSLIEIQQQALIEGGLLPDYATVFRMMILLESMSIVHKVNLKRSCSYYELTDPSRHHDHLVCTDCGQVTLLDIPCPVEATERFIEEKFGYTGIHHSLEFFGRCAACTARVNSTFELPVTA
jgi:Fe2+ or Zn2+ uptake regulation protein